MKRPSVDIDTLIFDFDGTLADTMGLGIKISNILAGRFGYKQIQSKEELHGYRNIKTQEALKAIGISRLKLPVIANRFRKMLGEEISTLKPIDGVAEMIESLSANYQMGIVTSNSSKNIQKFLITNKLKNHFTFYSTGISLFKKDVSIKSLIRKNKLSANRVMLIGDETRDIEAAHEANIAVTAVSWGFHTAELLAEMRPDFLINSPKELSALLTK